MAMITSADLKEARQVSKAPESGGMIVAGDPASMCHPKAYQSTQPNLSDLFPYGKTPWKGRRAWVVASGPSAKAMRPKWLDGELVIAANRAVEKYPFAAFHCSLDPRYNGWRLNAEKVYGEAAAEGYAKARALNVYALLPQKYIEHDAAARDTPVYRIAYSHDAPEYPPRIDRNFGEMSNSGFFGVMLAWALGASEIHLVGFDMNVTGGKCVWDHDGHPCEGTDDCYEAMIADFEKAAEYMEANGLRVVNHNPDSGLTMFPFSTYEAIPAIVKQGKPKRPRIVAYHTGGPYAKEAKAMAEGAYMMGLSTDILHCEDRGGWQNNTYRKAEYLLECCENAPNGAVLCYLDVDARILRYPDGLDNFTGDWSVPIIDWSTEPGVSFDHEELVNNIILFRNVKAVRELLAAWMAENGRQAAIKSHILEQQNLQKVWMEGRASGRWSKIKAQAMPLSHAHIHGMMNMAPYGSDGPVINQMQASRRLRDVVGHDWNKAEPRKADAYVDDNS